VYRGRLLAEDLTPVSRLSQAFLRPPTPADLQFAYFEASLVVEHILERYGLDALKRVLADLGADAPLAVALARHVAPLERLDAEFAAFARQRAEAFAPGVDWSDADLPAADAAPDALAKWQAAHPRNYPFLLREARRLIAGREWSAAKAPLAELQGIDPTAALPLLAQAHRELNETGEERAALESLAQRSDDALDAYARLGELAAAAGDWPAVERNAQRALAVNPLAPAPYRQWARAAQALGDRDGAILAWRALLVVDASDPSENHYRLARLYFDQGDLPAARRHVLDSLEETPRYRAAQRLLLEIVDRFASGKAASAQGPSESRTAAKGPGESNAPANGAPAKGAPAATQEAAP
jgi:tetratricopeptide (TPR) repeat protein